MDEGIKSVLRNMEHLEEKMSENSSNLETRVIEKMLENTGNLKKHLEEKLMENSGNLEAKMLENCVNLEERLENKLSETKQQLDQKIREIESQFALLSSKTDLSPPGAADENVGEVNSSPNKDVKIKESKESPACSVADDKEQHSIRHTTCETKMRMKPPQFDGKTPWPNYLRQFKAAAKTNDWSMDEKATALTLALRGDATDILQTLPSAEQADYEQLIKHLEMRYGQTNLEYVYHSQLKNRYQKPSETLKEFQVDISRLVRLAYPATPEAVMERLAVQAFLDGLRDGETRQALILARPTNLVDALTRALEFEAAKQCAKGQARIRQVEEDSNGDTMEATIRKFVKEALSEAKKVQCWKCGKVGHIKRRCPENQAVATATVPEKRNRVDDKGQPSIRDPQAPRKIAQVASLEHQSNSIFIDALVDGKPRELLLDTGATRTIIRPDIVGTSTKVKPTPWRLRTATGQPATIHGEVGVIFNIGNTCFNGQVLVADIEDELILGMDIMNTKGFKLDFKRGVLQINEEEVVLHGRTEERVRVVLAEDSSISERCEAILYACPDGRYDEGSIMMVEPGTHDSEGGHGVVIGKSLSHVRKIVPVRVMNVNYHPVTLKKGTVLGYCCPVASIVRSLGTTRENSAEISAELEGLIKTSSRHLKMDQRKITTVLDDNWQIEKIKIDQENDPELKHIMTWKKEGRRPTWAEIARYSPFGCPPGEDIAGEDYVTTLRRRMDDIHDQVRSNIQSASDRMKETYDIGAQNDGYQSEAARIITKVTDLVGGPYEVLARINDVVYRIKKSSGGKPRVVHFNRLTPFSGSNDASVRTVVPSTHEMSFENFMAQYSPNHKARYGVTREEQRDLFQVPAEFALAHCVAQDLQMSRGIAAAFKEKFGNVDELRRQRPEVGDVLQLGGDETSRRVFYLVTKHLSRDKPTYENVWESLISLRGALLSQEVTHLAIPKLSCGLDGLNWRVVRNMLEVLFQFTGIEVLVCSYHPGVPIAERTVDCYFYQQSRCKKGSLCRYRHHPTLRTLSGTERCLRRGQCNESASSVPSTALSPLTSREHDLTTFELTPRLSRNVWKQRETFDGNQEQRSFEQIQETGRMNFQYLLGLRAIIKEDLQSSPAELVNLYDFLESSLQSPMAQ
ncbi:hypothetical protein NQ317_016236 [Molorchus minor]|uniref:Cleavage and polyadenylation specificity factor subunit 4 n=1 Tax=Molorchus minor TaxID=1323400 RepID=A0ABQ9JDF1_9CUCU|nr:hypothetical protein NQ317_016236 [Molorchus minor]